MKIIDGKEISQKIRVELKAKAEEFHKKAKRRAGLAVVLVGTDSASEIYVRNKIKACEETCVQSFAYYLPEHTGEDELISLVKTLNHDTNVDGILVQLPLPKHINEERILDLIKPDKDVDGFHEVNAGRLMQGKSALTACTPTGCLELIKSTGEKIEGKNAVVIGRSNIVGKPMALLLLNENATVTICHSRTKNLKEIAASADILVAAIGRAEFVTGDMIKDGAIVVDVGINRVDGKIKGDVNFEEAAKKCSFITPVPGGVGPMTITMLIKNTISAAFNNIK